MKMEETNGSKDTGTTRYCEGFLITEVQPDDHHHYYNAAAQPHRGVNESTCKLTDYNPLLLISTPATPPPPAQNIRSCQQNIRYHIMGVFDIRYKRRGDIRGGD